MSAPQASGQPRLGFAKPPASGKKKLDLIPIKHCWEARGHTVGQHRQTAHSSGDGGVLHHLKKDMS